MKVGIIGAGLSGLAAARTLVAAGHDVVVIEKSRGVGGRLASRRVDGSVVDHGAPVIPRGESAELADLVDALPGDERVDLDGGHVAYRSGVTRLAKLMAHGIDVVLGVRIAALRAAGNRLELAGEQGNAHGVVDAVIVSAPAPQAADLLDNSPGGAERAAILRTARYDPAVMIVAGWTLPEPTRLEPFAVPLPFVRITAENVKGRPLVDGIVPVVARLAPEPSSALMDVSDDAILADVLPVLARSCGASGEPAWVQVKRWRYAVPARTVDAASVNPAGTRIRVCGDAIAPGGLGPVYTSGVAAAEAVTESLAEAR